MSLVPYFLQEDNPWSQHPAQYTSPFPDQKENEMIKTRITFISSYWMIGRFGRFPILDPPLSMRIWMILSSVATERGVDPSLLLWFTIASFFMKSFTCSKLLFKHAMKSGVSPFSFIGWYLLH